MPGTIRSGSRTESCFRTQSAPAAYGAGIGSASDPCPYRRIDTAEGYENRIDPDLWRPLMMSFCQFYGLGERLHDSTLAEIPEVAYRPAAHMGLATANQFQ